MNGGDQLFTPAEKAVYMKCMNVTPSHRISIIFGLFGMDARQICRQTMAVLLHMHSGFPTKLMEQMIVTSLDDVTRFSHVQ